MMIIDKLKKLFSPKINSVKTMNVISEATSSTTFIDDFSSSQVNPLEIKASSVLAFDVEELSYVLECQNRRYCKDLTL